jgi:hypothetical protein
MLIPLNSSVFLVCDGEITKMSFRDLLLLGDFDFDRDGVYVFTSEEEAIEKRGYWLSLKAVTESVKGLSHDKLNKALAMIESLY